MVKKPSKGGEELTKRVLVEDDDGLNFPLPPQHASWLNEAGESPIGRGQVQDRMRSFADTLSTLRRLRGSGAATEGELQHRLGTSVRDFRGHSAWKVLDIETFEDFCEQRLAISRSYGYRLVFFAGVVTEEQASFGVRKCLAGVALAGTLEADGLGALLPRGRDWKEPPAWAERLGEPVDFAHSSAARLERLLRKLAAPALPAAAPTRRVVSVVASRQAIIERVAEKHPELTTLEAKSYAHDGKAKVSHAKATTDDDCAALAAMYGAFVKK